MDTVVTMAAAFLLALSPLLLAAALVHALDRATGRGRSAALRRGHHPVPGGMTWSGADWTGAAEPQRPR